MPPTTLNLKPIGVARTSLASKAEAARQPRAAPDAAGRIELYPHRNFEHALEDLAGWEYIWVIFWFHLNRTWRPKVLPPRSTSGRKGLFATRSPHRPNPLGLSAVRLERIEGLTLYLREVDIVDGSPVLDIKPYVPYTDAHPGARSGWLEDVEARRAKPAGVAPADPLAEWAVNFEPLAAQQAEWIEAATGLPIRARIVAALALGPEPRAYRRIRRTDEGLLLKVKEWRVRFAVDGHGIRVVSLASGYRPAEIAASGRTVPDPLRPHREFRARWMGSPPG